LLFLEKENNFTWTTKSTKLFLESYAERKEKFRDPKIKKKSPCGGKLYK